MQSQVRRAEAAVTIRSRRDVESEYCTCLWEGLWQRVSSYMYHTVDEGRKAIMSCTSGNRRIRVRNGLHFLGPVHPDLNNFSMLRASLHLSLPSLSPEPSIPSSIVSQSGSVTMSYKDISGQQFGAGNGTKHSIKVLRRHGGCISMGKISCSIIPSFPRAGIVNLAKVPALSSFYNLGPASV